MLIGIEDVTKNVLGLENPLDEEERLCSLIADSIEPRLAPNVELITWQNKTLLAVEVYPSGSRPHWLKREGPMQGVYVRLGSPPLSKTEPTEQVQRLLLCLQRQPLAVREIMQSLKLNHRPTLLYDYLKPAIDGEFVEMTQPDSPKSPTQKYRLTKKGERLANGT